MIEAKIIKKNNKNKIKIKQLALFETVRHFFKFFFLDSQNFLLLLQKLHF